MTGVPLPDFIEKEVDKLTKITLAESNTYDDALKNYNSKRLIYKHGKIGGLIDSAVRERITALALMNKINRETLS